MRMLSRSSKPSRKPQYQLVLASGRLEVLGYHVSLQILCAGNSAEAHLSKGSLFMELKVMTAEVGNSRCSRIEDMLGRTASCIFLQRNGFLRLAWLAVRLSIELLSPISDGCCQEDAALRRWPDT